MKRKQKEMEKEKELMITEHHGEFGKNEGTIFKTEARGQIAESYVKAEQTRERQVEERKAGVYKAKAEEETKMGILGREKEVELAKARDNYLISQKKVPRFLEQVLKRHQKEDTELIGSSDFDRSMAKLRFIKQSMDSIMTSAAGGTLTPKQQEEMESLENESRNLQSFLYARGPLFAGGGEGVMTDGMPPMALNAGNIIDEQALELSKLLNKRINADANSVKLAMEELRTKMGDKFGTFMQSYVAGLSDSAENGAINKAGLFREVYDASTGKTTFRAATAADADWTKGKRDWARSQSKSTKIQGFDMSLDKRVGNNGKEVVKIETQEAIDNTAAIFGSISTNRVDSVDNNNIETFNRAFENMNSLEVQQLVNAMRQKASDPDGIRALLSRTNLRQRMNQPGFYVNNAQGQLMRNIDIQDRGAGRGPLFP